MIKDMIIAALVAGYALRCPWFAVCDVATQVVIWLNLSICLLFFCLFLEEKHENWLKKRERALKLQDRVIKLCGGNRYADERSRIKASR